VDAFTVAAEMLGGLELTAGQLAQLRAINRKYWTEVFSLLHARRDDASLAGVAADETPAAHTATPTLTEQQTAELRAMLEREIDKLLTSDQRATLYRVRSSE
jgi:Spy/CpxP family protein refolding chaperone